MGAVPERREERSAIAPGTLAAAAVGSAAATFLVARFGLAGTIAGAAITPVVISVVSELVRRSAARRGRRTEARPVREGGRTVYRAPRGRPRLRFSWRRVVATAAAAFALVVAGITVADFAFGNSVASDRDSTFLSPEPEGPKEEQEREEEAPGEPTEPPVTTPETTTEDVPPETAPTPTEPTTGTEPTVTTP